MTRLGESVREGRMVLRPVSKNQDSKQLTVPARLARVIPPDSVFVPELVADGILFRFVGIREGEAFDLPVDVPAWAAENGTAS